MMALMLRNTIYLFDVCLLVLSLRRVRELFVLGEAWRGYPPKMLGCRRAIPPRKFISKIPQCPSQILRKNPQVN